MSDEDEELVELSAEELAELRHSITQHVRVPAARGWSTSTFVCCNSPSSCILSCCCPCLQFGLNQRAAFGSSCAKWALLYVLPLVLLYLAVDHYYPSLPTAERAAEQAVKQLDEDDADSFDRGDAFLHALPVGLALVGCVGMLRRRALRQKYGIGGSLLSDFLCHFCCTSCSLAREAREIRKQTLDEVVAGAEQDLTSV